MVANRKRIQPYEVAMSLRNKGVSCSAQDVRAMAERMMVGRVIRQTAIGLVFTTEEADRLVAAIADSLRSTATAE
jgi:hypothetical protein